MAPQPTGSLGSHGPVSSDDNRNTKRRLDTFSSPEDEHARCADLLQFPCEQHHAGVSTWINRIWATANIPACNNKPIRIIVKQERDSYSRRELNARILWLGTRMMVSLTKLTVHFCYVRTNITQSASPSHLKTGKLDNDLRLCGKVWPKRSKLSFLKEMTLVPSLSLYSTNGHKFSVLRIAGAAWEKTVFKLAAPLGTNSCLILLLLICVFLTFLMMQ